MANERLLLYDSGTNEGIMLAKSFAQGWDSGSGALFGDYIGLFLQTRLEGFGNDITRLKILTDKEYTQFDPHPKIFSGIVELAEFYSYSPLSESILKTYR